MPWADRRDGDEYVAGSMEDAVALLQDENLLTVTLKVGLPQLNNFRNNH